jgi:hypothetical protein
MTRSLAPWPVRSACDRGNSAMLVGYRMGGKKIYYFELPRHSEGTLNRWSRLHLQSLALNNPHWARVVGYGSFSLCVIHKEGLSGPIHDYLVQSKHL